MAREKLTKHRIEGFSFEGAHDKARDVRWDTSFPGFGVRVYPSGRKTFVVTYRTRGGRQRVMALGQFGAKLSLEEARKKARRVLLSVDEGKDPLDDRRTERTEAQVKDLVARFLEEHVDARLRPTTAKEYRRQLETHVLPAWKSRPVRSIRRRDVAELHRKIGKTAPTQANRTIAAVSKMFSFALSTGYLDATDPNPAKGIERFREHKRDRWLKPAELPRVAEAINADPNPYHRAAIWLFLLTGARRGELLQARWDDVDWDRCELRFPEDSTKAHRTHVVPLSEAALTVLRGIPRVEGNPFILPGAKGGHLGDINHPWAKMREAAGVPDVRLHDLRRTVGSWLASHGESLPLIGKVLNHSTPSTTAIYARLAEDPIRRAMEEHGARITEAAKGVRVLSGGKGA